MPFTVKDFQGLLRLLERQPKWKDELRAVLLGEEFLELPRLTKDLVQAQEATQRELRALAQAQRATNKSIRALAEAQRRAEERLGRLEERTDRLEEAVAALAEAQRRTEEQLAQLAGEVRALAESQKHTEQQVAELARQVGRLSDTLGFTLEELARELSPAFLEKHHGIRVRTLHRRFFTTDGKEIEVDFYGEGERDDEPVVIVGEVRSRIYGRDVESLLRKVQDLLPVLPARPVPVLFGFVIHPSAVEAAEHKGVLVLAPVGLPRT